VGHAALTGVAIGILLGEPYTGPYGSLFGYCLLFGILLNYLRNRTGLAPDTLIGVFLSVSLALGASLLLILAGKINVHILENVLFGSVLTVNGWCWPSSVRWSWPWPCRCTTASCSPASIRNWRRCVGWR
jgi:zinc transport system permease protein